MGQLDFKTTYMRSMVMAMASRTRIRQGSPARGIPGSVFAFPFAALNLAMSTPRRTPILPSHNNPGRQRQHGRAVPAVTRGAPIRTEPRASGAGLTAYNGLRPDGYQEEAAGRDRRLKIRAAQSASHGDPPRPRARRPE